MVKILEIENQLREVIARIQAEVKLSSKQGRTDINLVSEDAWIPILKEVYQCPNLINLNNRKNNFPGLDLGDYEERVSFQITATTNLEKIKKTIRIFKEQNHNNSFDEVYVFVLTDRQRSYSQNAIDKECAGVLSFDGKKHVIDPGDVLKKISSLRPVAQERLLNEFKLILGDIEESKSRKQYENQYPHTLVSNLCPLSVPEKVHSAVLDIDKKEVVSRARAELGFKQRYAYGNTLLKLALLLNGVHANEWTTHEGKVFTFIDLEDNADFSQVIDSSTIETIESSELYDSEFEEYYRLFNSLLRKSLSTALQKRFVEWNNQDKVFYFLPTKKRDKIRKEIWQGKSRGNRRVYEVKYQTKDPTKIAHHRHLCFRVDFIYNDNKWYCAIKPGWLYTHDKYSKSRYHDKLLSGQKRLEFNSSVRDLTRFIAYFLANTKSKPSLQPQFESLMEFQYFSDSDNNHDEDSQLADQNS